jgi:RES domain-containing protein
LPLEVDAVDPAGAWLRQIPRGADPDSRPQPPGDGRWQRGHVVDALYLASDEATMWAEWYRHLAERGVPPLAQLPRDVWRYRVRSAQVADLTASEQLARVGLAAPAPGRKGWPSYQHVGETLWREGWQGLLAPSAALPAGSVLCLFVPPRGGPPAEAVPPPTVVAKPPLLPAGMQT